MPAKSPAAPLALIGEPRIEQYELLSPAGLVVEVTHNIDSGEFSYNETTRTQLADDEQS